MSEYELVAFVEPAFRDGGVVRVTGETLARWIADSGSPVERVLDLRTNQLVEVQ
jgi:hypothetical protein